MEKATIKSYQPSRWQELKKDLIRNKSLYLMIIPVVAYYFIFHYIPMYGLQIAFKDFTPAKGIWGSPWVGLEKFKEFFVYDSFYVWRIIRNTILINVYDLIFGFPAPIIFALLLNEIKNSIYKRTLQTVSYMPHFISTVVIVGMIMDFFARDGLINQILKSLGILSEPISFMTEPGWFRPLYVGSGIWQNLGWGSIVYLAAISNIDPQLYEAALIDGAGRFRQTLYVTIPGILPTIVIMFLLRVGHMMNVGFEKVFLMYNPLTYETADVISTYVYSLLEMDYSYGAAVGLFNSVINFLLVIFSNKIAKKLTETSLW